MRYFLAKQVGKDQFKALETYQYSFQEVQGAIVWYSEKYDDGVGLERFRTSAKDPIEQVKDLNKYLMEKEAPYLVGVDFIPHHSHKAL